MCKNHRYFTRPCVVNLAVLASLAFPAAVIAQPTAFTYQGQLKNGGSPASGAFDMVFRLFDAETVGTQIGIDQPLPGTTVSNGLFTSSIDFGAGMFDGTPRWLEIEVNSVVLTPRQALTSAPYAQRATDAQSCNVANYAYGPWVPSGTDLYYNDGNIGIGTSTPTAKLEIVGMPGVDGIKFPDGTVQTSATVGAAGYWSANGTHIYKNNAGFVGIGTSTPASKLDIASVGDGAEVLRLSTERPWVFKQAYSGSGTALRLQSTVGLKSFEITASQGGNCATFFADDTTIGPRVGIGTTAPLSKLDIAASGAGAELLRFTTERPWIFRQIYSGPSTGLQLYSTSGAKNFEITCSSGVNCATFFTQDAAPRVGIGTNTPTTTLDVNGTTRTKVLQIMGADLAEKFPTNDTRIEPGTVMEIDPDHAGKLRVANGAYNQRVAGVVSGANNFPAGAILGNMDGAEDSPAIALTGRVWVKCDASTQAIRIGDLLTTSPVAGHAMKAVDRQRSQGAAIGKAMTSLAAGERGLVLVLVNLQ